MFNFFIKHPNPELSWKLDNAIKNLKDAEKEELRIKGKIKVVVDGKKYTVGMKEEKILCQT